MTNFSLSFPQMMRSFLRQRSWFPRDTVDENLGMVQQNPIDSTRRDMYQFFDTLDMNEDDPSSGTKVSAIPDIFVRTITICDLSVVNDDMFVIFVTANRMIATMFEDTFEIYSICLVFGNQIKKM
jgi:hypothetical protein